MKKHWLPGVIVTLCFFIISPCGVNCLEEQVKASIENSKAKELTPAQEYAGEILSYLLRVVLGRAGNLKFRKDWAARGLEERLDYHEISEIMKDHEQNELLLLVLDPNILELSNVLYHYDKRLSLYKGALGITSVYPAPEIAALRLFLLQRIHSGKKVNVKALIENKRLLTDPRIEPTREDMEALDLSPREMKLLRDILFEEPHIYGYLNSPYLIKALYECGAVEGDDFVKEKIRHANYQRFPCRHFEGSRRPDAVKILFLPSLIREFHFGDPYVGLSQAGFAPTDFFTEMANKLKREILESTKALINGKIIKGRPGERSISGKEWEGLWKSIEDKISFFIQDDRPLVIYPDNAGQEIRNICPEADFTIVLLDKNIYLSIYFDDKKDTYPHVNRLYIDIMDIKYAQIQEEKDHISEFIFSRIKEDLEKILEGRDAQKSP